ncbi:ATP-grasp domain-containing protein, partial [Clostridioides difficile]|nr:ATP-grasp domain-containing protein [Clostridioides difficile]
AMQCQQKKLILLVCDCYYAELIIENKEQLEKYFILPYIDQALLNRVQTKEKFYRLCDKYQLKYPKTIIITKEHHSNREIPIQYPIIIKPSNTVA